MRVLQICAAYKPAFIYGGPTMSVSMLSEQLVAAGIKATVYATTANGREELPVIAGEPVMVDGVPVIYFKRITGDHTHFSPALLKKLWNEARSFDLIHIHAWWNLVSLFSCLIALVRKVPVALSPRGTLSPYSFHNRNIGPKWLLHHLFGKPLLMQCHVHATSGREEQAVFNLFKPKSISVLPNFVKLAQPATSSAIEPASQIRLIFLSRIEEKKGLDILLHALAGVTVPFYLTIAGDGDPAYIESLKTTAQNCRLNDHISWIGFSGENKFNLLREHDLLVLPSYDENFGNVVIESLSVGTAVLISEHVGLSDYVKENKLGWVCQSDARSVGKFIHDIAGNYHAELHRIRTIGPDIIHHDFNNQTLVKKYITMYQQLQHHD